MPSTQGLTTTAHDSLRLSAPDFHRQVTLVDPAGAENPEPVGIAVSQEDLAMMLGVSRQSVNRQLKLWEDAGLLRLEYKRIVLLAPQQLMNVSAL